MANRLRGRSDAWVPRTGAAGDDGRSSESVNDRPATSTCSERDLDARQWDQKQRGRSKNFDHEESGSTDRLGWRRIVTVGGEDTES
jgi:hypothetical protein